MHPVHPAKDTIVKTLDANGQTIHAGGHPCANRIIGDVFRIGLERHFGATGDRHVFAHDVHQQRDTIRPKSRWGSAPEIQRVEHGRRQWIDS